MPPKWLVPACSGVAAFGLCGLFESATFGVALGVGVASVTVILIRRFESLSETRVRTQLEGAFVLASVALIAVLMYEPRGRDWEHAGTVAVVIFFVLMIAAGAQRFRNSRRDGGASS